MVDELLIQHSNMRVKSHGIGVTRKCVWLLKWGQRANLHPDPALLNLRE